MPKVAVNINGKIYTIACETGQEAHLLELAEKFNESIQQLKQSFGEIGDQRLTVMAGIIAYDKLLELQLKFDELKLAMEKSQAHEQEVCRHVKKITEQVQNITQKLRS